MKKIVLSVVFTLTLVLAMIPISTAFAGTEKVLLSVEASDTTPNAKEEVTFTVYYEANQTCTGIQFDLDIPAGLTYIPNSGEMVRGFQKTANAPDEASFTEVTKRVIVASLPGMTLNQKIAVAQFRCTVDDGVTGIKNITLKDPCVIGAGYQEMDLSDIKIIGANVNITKTPIATKHTQLRVTADKTAAKPGDTINFTVTLGPVSNMGTMQMDAVIPTGLTYVANSGKLADSLTRTLGFDKANWVEDKKRIDGISSASDYNSDTDTVLATFQCTVNEGFTGTTEVGLGNLEFYSCRTWEDNTSYYSVVKAEINVASPNTPDGDATVTEQKAAVKKIKLKLRSQLVKTAAGKKAIKLTWTNPSETKFDGVEIYRSLKKNSGYGKKPIFISKTDKYTNTSVRKGKTYYYKVRGFVTIEGEKVYTDWSSKAIRTVK